MLPRRLAIALTGLAVATATMAACSSSGSGTASGGSGGALRVVASTDVYGSIVQAIAGDAVELTTFIDDPSQDPHSFEASTRNQLAIAKADVIIENGGGYDDFIDRMRSASAKDGAVTLNAVRLSGHRADASGELNEHVWYDFRAVDKLVARLVGVLAKDRPSDAGTFRANAARFESRLHGLEAQETALRSKYAGTAVSITEPVPLYLLTACGLVNRTPPQFSAAVEEGNDVPATTLRDTIALYTQHEVRALFYNAQTTDPQTEQVLAIAKQNDVAVVPVTETLPAGTTYLTWMAANLAHVRTALTR